MPTKREKIDYIESQLFGRYKWRREDNDLVKGKHGYSLREIGHDVAKHFDLPRPVSPALISNYLRIIRESWEAPSEEELSEAERLLAPENFPDWRAKMFVAPDGQPYSTPVVQQALFWVLICLALKRDIPQWVIDYWELPADINDLLHQHETKERAEQVLFTVICLVAPRHGKTELVLHAIIWLICYNPNIRIIYLQGISTTSKEGMEYIKAELEGNEELNRLYGPFRDDNCKWNSDVFFVAKRDINQKAPTMRPIGIGSNIRSMDADIIIVDDPQDMDRAESETVGDRDFRWVKVELFTRREPWTPIFGVGSHLPVPWGDLWYRLEEAAPDIETENQRLIIRKKPAHDTDKCGPDGEHWGCLAWPEKRGIGFLEAQRALLTDELFEAVYQQNPKPEGIQYFDPNVLDAYYVRPEKKRGDGSWDQPPLPADQEHYGVKDLERSYSEDVVCCGQIVNPLGFDPAAGESKGASQSAAVLLAICASCRRRYLVDWWAKRQSPEKNPDTIISFVRSYNLRRVRVEINAYQKALSRDRRLREAERELRFHVDEWRTDDRKNDPALGIPNSMKWMRDGMVSFPYKTHYDRQRTDQIIKAFKRYPRKPNDIPMAYWLAETLGDSWIDELTVSVPTTMPGHEDLPEHLALDVYEVDLSLVGNI